MLGNLPPPPLAPSSPLVATLKAGNSTNPGILYGETRAAETRRAVIFTGGSFLLGTAARFPGGGFDFLKGIGSDGYAGVAGGAVCLESNVRGRDFNLRGSEAWYRRSFESAMLRRGAPF